MSSEKDTKIKNVMRLVHRKGVVTAVYLRRQGVSYQSMLKYRQSDWLRSLGNGAFCESGDVPSIDAALAAIDEQLGLPIHLGGKTALAERGIMQYVPIGGLPSEIYLRRGVRLPKWFSDTYFGRFVCKRSCLFSDETGVEHREAACAVSSPERAFLELAAEVPQRIALGELYQLMEFADTLRPKLVSELLAKCGSVKAKRVFLLLADDLGYRWSKRVDHSGIDLGAGCRVIDKGGEFQPKYTLVVKPWREY